MLHCKAAKSIINNSRSDWFSKANILEWAEPCARWAELKMLSFWAGGISSFLPCTREYRLLRRLEVIKNERQSNLTEHRQGFKGNLSTTFCDQFIFHHLDNEQAL